MDASEFGLNMEFFICLLQIHAKLLSKEKKSKSVGKVDMLASMVYINSMLFVKNMQFFMIPHTPNVFFHSNTMVKPTKDAQKLAIFAPHQLIQNKTC